MESKPSNQIGLVIGMTAFIFFAFSSSLVTLLERFHIMEIIFFQNIFRFLLVAPFCVIKKTLKFDRSLLKLHLIRDIGGVLSFSVFFTSINAIGLVDASVLYFLSPFIIPFAVKWIDKTHKISASPWWTTTIGFIGMIVIFKPGSEIFHPLSLLGLLAAFFSAISWTAMSALTQKGEPISKTLFYFFLVGIIISFPFLFFYWKMPNAHEWLILLYFAMSSALAQFLLILSYRYTTALILAPASYMTLIFTIIFSWILFKESPAWTSLAGAFCIILGGLLSIFFRKKRAKDVIDIYGKEFTPPK